MQLVEKAKTFAMAAHAAIGQIRKYTGEPYSAHPQKVAALVESATKCQHAIAAAHLHDVVEDTGVSLDLIRAEFGDVVARLVDELTDVSRPEDGNRAARKAKDLAHTAMASPIAKTIKLADLIDNTASIVERDPEFARVYLREKAALLAVLKDGNGILWFAAKNMLEVACQKLGMDEVVA